MQTYSFDGKAAGLKLANIPTNGAWATVRIDGREFQVRALSALDSRKRSFMARLHPALNSFVWDWHVQSMGGLRDKLRESAKDQNDYAASREAFLKAQGINLQPAKDLI